MKLTFTMALLLFTSAAYSQDLTVFEEQQGEYRMYGYKDKAGKVVIPAQYRDAFDFSEGITAVRSGNLYGFIDAAGKVVVNFQYAYAESPAEGLAVVAYDSRWGFINTKGELIIPMELELAYSFKDGFAEVKHRGEKYMMDKEGFFYSKDFVDSYRAALTGNVDAMVDVGVRYYTNDGVLKNY